MRSALRDPIRRNFPSGVRAANAASLAAGHGPEHRRAVGLQGRPLQFTASAPAPGAAARKLSFKEQRELDELPARIEALEAEQAQITERLASSELYTREPQQVAPLKARHAAIEDELMAALERSEALSARS